MVALNKSTPLRKTAKDRQSIHNSLKWGQSVNGKQVVDFWFLFFVTIFIIFEDRSEVEWVKWFYGFL